MGYCKYKENTMVELVDENYIDCCEWMKVGDRYVIIDIDSEGRVILEGLFRNEYANIIDLDKSFKICDRIKNGESQMGYKEHLKAGNIVVIEYKYDEYDKLTGIILSNGNIVWLEESMWCDTDSLEEDEVVGIYEPIDYGVVIEDINYDKIKDSGRFKCIYSKGLTISDMEYNVEYKATKFDKYTYRITKLKIYGNDFIACQPIGNDYTECSEAKRFEFHKIEEI